MNEWLNLPLSELRKIARARFGKDVLRIGDPFQHNGGFFPTNDDDPRGQPAAECCFELEDGTGHILVETGDGCIQPEICGTTCLELEDGTGHILVEPGTGCIQQET